MSRIATARKLAADTLVTTDRLTPSNYLDFRSTYSLGLCLAYAVQQGHVTQVSQSGIALLEETLDSAHFALGEQGQSALDTVAMELAETRTASALEDFANPSEIAEGDTVKISLVELGPDAPVDVAKIVTIEVAGDGQRTFWVMPTQGGSVALFPIDEHDEGWKIERIPTLDEVLEEAAVPRVGDYATYLGATYQVESRYSDGTASLTDSMTGARISAKLSELTIVR